MQGRVKQFYPRQRRWSLGELQPGGALHHRVKMQDHSWLSYVNGVPKILQAFDEVPQSASPRGRHYKSNGPLTLQNRKITTFCQRIVQVVP